MGVAPPFALISLFSLIFTISLTFQKYNYCKPNIFFVAKKNSEKQSTTLHCKSFYNTRYFYNTRQLLETGLESHGTERMSNVSHGQKNRQGSHGIF